MMIDNKIITSGHVRDGLLINPYLLGLISGMCYPFFSFIISAVTPLSRTLRELNKSLWEQLPVISMLFPYQQSKIPLWVSGASVIWTAMVMGVFLILMIRWCKWIGVVLAPIIATISFFIFRRILFGNYYKIVGFWMVERDELWMLYIILAGFVAGILLGGLLLLLAFWLFKNCHKGYQEEGEEN